MKINMNHPQITDVNISKAQPSKASGLGGVVFLRSKSAPTLYIRTSFNFRHVHFAYCILSLCWNVIAKTQIKLRNQSSVEEAMDQQDMDPTLRGNMRRYNDPILKRRSIALPALFVFIFFLVAGLDLEYVLQAELSVSTGCLLCMFVNHPISQHLKQIFGS